MQNISERITSNKSRHLLETILEAINHFEEAGTQNYLVFQPVYKYFKTINSIGNISGWKSKGLPNESIKTPSTSNNFLNPLLNYVGTKIRVKFSGSFLKENAA